jgi:hypothetical protein
MVQACVGEGQLAAGAGAQVVAASSAPSIMLGCVFGLPSCGSFCLRGGFRVLKCSVWVAFHHNATANSSAFMQGNQPPCVMCCAAGGREVVLLQASGSFFAVDPILRALQSLTVLPFSQYLVPALTQQGEFNPPVAVACMLLPQSVLDSALPLR